MINKPTRLTITLVALLATNYVYAQTEQLDQIIVTANNVEQSLHSVTANAFIITQQEIEDKQYTTLAQALRQVPGITISNSGGIGKATSIFMRGQSNNATLILVDGVEMTNQMGTGGTIVEALLMSNIERIEIIKGPQSGIWGANASAGVINIITKRAQNIANVTLEKGSWNTKRIAASLGAADENIDFILNFSEFTTDGFSAVKSYRAPHNKYERDGYKQTDINFKLGINLTKNHRLQANITTSSAVNQWDWATNPNQIASNNYTKNLKKIKYQFTQENINLSIYALENEINQFNQAKLTETGVRVGFTYLPNQRLAFSLVNKDYEGSGGFPMRTHKANNKGIALNNTNQFLNNSLIVTQAIRYDEYNKFDNKITGKFGIKNHFTDNIFISANYGTAYNAPTLFHLNHGTTINLQPEETKSYDITFGFYGLELTYFNSETKNLITYGGTWPNDFYSNLTGISKFTGIEASYIHSFDRIDTDLTANFTQLSAKDSNGQWLARRAEQQAGFSIDNYSINNLNLGLQIQYRGTTYDRANQQGAQIGEYYVANITANYEVNAKLTVFAKIINVMDEDYTNAVATYQAGTVTPQYVYGMGGRQFSVGVRGSF